VQLSPDYSSGYINRELMVLIIVPVLNEYENLLIFLKGIDALDSPDRYIKFIFVDGYSTDGSYELLQTINHDSIIIRSTPRGIYDAYNKGLDCAEDAKYIMFMGADDLVLPGLITLCESIDRGVIRHPLIVAQSQFSPGSEISTHRFDQFNLLGSNFCHQSILFRSDLFLKKRFDVRYRVMADWVMNLQLIKKYGRLIHYTPLLISRYFKGGYSGTSRDLRWEICHYALKIRYLGYRKCLKYLLVKGR
jgi:hypothetical protein